MTEVLVLLSATTHISAHELARTEPFEGAGVQVFGPRVLTARLRAEACALVAEIEDVEGVFEGIVPFDLLPDDPVGRVATDAWNARRSAQYAEQTRIGDGVAWDDPRFEREGEQHGKND